MNRKTIIEVIVIVGAFVGAGVVLYNGLFKNSQSGVDPLLEHPKAIEKILPYGDTFNYKQLEELKLKKFQFGVISYPKVNPSTEVGKNVDTLLESLNQDFQP